MRRSSTRSTGLPMKVLTRRIGRPPPQGTADSIAQRADFQSGGGFPRPATGCLPQLGIRLIFVGFRTRTRTGGFRMKRWVAALLIAGMPQLAAAAEVELNDQQKLGWRLYETSCGICHTRPTLIAGMFGPEINKESASGQEEVMREIITNGTPRMPGFKYTYSPDQIAAIAAYLKTLSV